jgi:hypothetical protein
MVAVLGADLFARGVSSPLDLAADPGLSLVAP